MSQPRTDKRMPSCKFPTDGEEHRKLDHFQVKLTPLVDGTLYVSIWASVIQEPDETETNIIDEDIVDTMSDALQFIGQSLADYEHTGAKNRNFL